jgi:hypothetical protein
LVFGSSARSVAKGDPGAILTRRKQRVKTVRTTGMLDNNLLVKKVSIGGYVVVEGLVFLFQGLRLTAAYFRKGVFIEKIWVEAFPLIRIKH